MASERLAYFNFYPLDFSSDDVVECMETEAVGAYMLLLCKAWHQKPVGTLPDDDESLARWCRLPLKKWLKHKSSITKAFYRGDDGRWHQKKMESEYQKALDAIGKKSQSGAKGAATRWQRHSDAMAPPMPNQWQKMANQNQYQLNTPLPPKGGRCLDGFGPGRNTIADPSRLRLWLTEIGPKIGLPDNHETLLRVLGAAIRANAAGDDPPKLFGWLVANGIGGDWSFISAEQMDRAKTQLLELEANDTNSAAAADLAGKLTEQGGEQC